MTVHRDVAGSADGEESAPSRRRSLDEPRAEHLERLPHDLAAHVLCMLLPARARAVRGGVSLVARARARVPPVATLARARLHARFRPVVAGASRAARVRPSTPDAPRTAPATPFLSCQFSPPNLRASGPS